MGIYDAAEVAIDCMGIYTAAEQLAEKLLALGVLKGHGFPAVP
jgi:hypothetical protein